MEREEKPIDTTEESSLDEILREESKKRFGVELTRDELIELANFDKCTWTIEKFVENQGILSLKRNTESIKKIAIVFPIIFFFTAVLIISTTMNRIVDNQRNTLGILEYLGYSTKQIIYKYFIYITFAIIIGGVIGSIAGNILIPKVVWQAYKLMYSIDKDIFIEYKYNIIIISFALMIFIANITTIYTVKKYIKAPIANLLKSKEDRIGHKNILEKTKIWEKLKFTRKIKIKNIIRYKKRFVITIIGVMCSITLIITGFGIYDGIAQLLEYQERKIWNYDIEINLNSKLSPYYLQEESTNIAKIEKMKETLQVSIQAGTITSDIAEEEIQIIIPKDNKKMNSFINLETTNNQKYELNDKSIAVTQKLSELLNIKEGDYVIITNNIGQAGVLQVGAIVKNYISHYVYISKRLYVDEIGSYNFNTVLAKRDINLLQSEKDELNSKILQRENVKYLVDTDSLVVLIDDQISSLNYVIILLIISARIIKFCCTIQFI